MRKTKMFLKITSVFLTMLMVFSICPVKTEAVDIVEELFDISFYYFHYLDENGKEKEDSFYNWGSEDKEKNGIKIEKTGMEKIQVVIDADSNELYMKCKPVLMWVHKADSLFDITKLTDIDKWYSNKLEETFLICAIPDYTQDCTITIDVPLKLNIGLTGLINGGYYEIEFYGEGAIPSQLEYAYRAQTYTLEELEEYMQYNMSDTIAEYYNADSGFRSNIDGLPFRNSDYEGGGGVCAGIAAVTTAKYNGYNLVTKYKLGDNEYIVSPDYIWYDNVYGNSSIHDINLEYEKFIKYNSPSRNINDDGSITAYPRVYFSNAFAQDEAFFSLLKYYLMENNTTVLLRGNTAFKNGVKLTNLENRWSIIDYVASYLRQGKAVTVNICSTKESSGHAIVGYRMEQVDENTLRLYCYDSNRPDDMELHYKKDADQNTDTDENGAYKNIIWKPSECYIDFTKKTVIGYSSMTSQREFDVFEFDSSHTSYNSNSSIGTISFSLCKGDSFGVFNYGSESNEIIAYRAFPVIMSDNTVQIRTFAYYKSGEVTEITNSINTTVKMNYNFIGWYKIKDSQITLTKNGYKFSNSGSKYIECTVTYDNHTDSYGSIQVRIPVST